MNTLRPSQLWRKDAVLASKINDVVNSQPFKLAMIYALSEYAQEASGRSDAGARLSGAREFIDKLLNMGNEPVERRLPAFNLPIDETTNQ